MDDRNTAKSESVVWGRQPSQFDAFARNISMDYIALAVEIVIGVVMLPFNIAHLGTAAYGLWVLTASVTAYFSMLDLGYGHAQVKFAAQYRALRDKRALNEIVSTLFFIFAGIGLVAYSIATLLAFNLESLFNITAEQAGTGRNVLLIIGAYVALGFPFSVFGGIVNGFQRQYVNGVVAIVTAVVAAIVNVVVLLAGYGLLELVAATTTVRILSYIAYRANAYRVFPGLRIRPRFFSLVRLREVTGFSAFILIIDLANKLNYGTDTLVIGVFMSTAMVAIWTVAQRLIDTTQQLTGTLNGVLFPVVVDSATAGDGDRLRLVFLQGTRLSLAMVILMATGLVLLAHPVVMLWVGPAFTESVPVIYLLAVAVTLRVGNSTATTVLKGAGMHRLLALSNVALAVSNVVLSVLLVRRYGLIGVALGTLMPLAAVSIFVLFPAACRRTGIPVSQALSAAVWPAVWPTGLVACLLIVTRNLLSASPATIVLQAALASLAYASLFLGLAVPSGERRWYLDKGRLLLRRLNMAVATH